MSFWPLDEDMALHDYELCADSDVRERISLIIPSVSSGDTFGGVATAIDIFLQLGRQTGADLRILQDQRGTGVDSRAVERRAQEIGLNASQIEIVPRIASVPRIPMRSTDVFVSFNWWGTLNLRRLLRKQSEHFGIEPRPYLHLIQEYEPFFYPFSSTHMYARLAFENRWPCWGIFNSKELYDYFVAQGHRMERSFVFEPRLSGSLRPFLEGKDPKKVRRILVYGRPYIARNCFSAVEKWPARMGWTKSEIISVGNRLRRHASSICATWGGARHQIPGKIVDGGIWPTHAHHGCRIIPDVVSASQLSAAGNGPFWAADNHQ